MDNKNRAQGRYLNIKPEIGLLKSTARTFIQDGITTEYVTQVLGTTQENGQYVQLLTTTSRVLYNVDNLQTKTYNPDKDNNSEDAFANNNPSSSFLRNIDYIVPNNPYLVFPIRNQKSNQLNDNVIYYNRDLELEETTNISPKAQKFVDNLSEDAKKIQLDLLKPNKVIPDADLPTYTVSKEGESSQFHAGAAPTHPTQSQRTGKILQKNESPEEDLKSLTSVTYFGFADFTTVVGDTVIVFSPSTAKAFNEANSHVTSIKGDATIKDAIMKSTVKPLVKPKQELSPTLHVQPLVLATKMYTKLVEPVYKVEQETTTESEEEVTEENMSEFTEIESSTEEIETTPTNPPVTTKLPKNELPSTTPKAIQKVTLPVLPSQPTPELPTNQLTKPSNEDVLKIFSSLASLEEAKKKQKPSSAINTAPIKAETKVLTGMKTVFFEDYEFESNTQITTLKSITLPQTTPESITETTENEEDEDYESTTEFNKETLEPKTEEPIEKINVLTPRPISADKKAEICATTAFKTLINLTTFFIPVDETLTTTSVKSNTVVSSTVENVNCDQIKPTLLQVVPLSTVTRTKNTDIRVDDLFTGDDSVEDKETTTMSIPEDSDSEMEEEDEDFETTTLESTTLISKKKEKTTVPSVKKDSGKKIKTTTESSTTIESVTEEQSSNEETTLENNEDEDIEIVYKTLYTTYTYLTTFFQESTSVVSSRKEILTNIITSTINGNDFASLLGNLETSKVSDEIKPTLVNDGPNLGVGRPTAKFTIPEENFVGVNNQIYENDGKLDSTPSLDDEFLVNSEIKTLYTTYTYFTTLFNEGKTEVVSRSEVFTNIIRPTSLLKDILETKFIGGGSEKDVSPARNRIDSAKKLNFERNNGIDEENNSVQSKPNRDDAKYSTMIRGSGELSSSLVEDNWDESIVKMVNDVKSSTSEGQRSFIDNVDRQWNVLDDQISSESNTEERIPSPTLLLQTRYTTFTYFTTMYAGKASSSVLSRLETITNVVTETLAPTQVQKLDEATLPVTYFTTFTYWTTFYKDGTTKVTSREDTISNVVTPTVPSELKIEESTPLAIVLPINQTAVVKLEDSIQPTVLLQTIETSQVNQNSNSADAKQDPVTLFTTFTFLATSYVGDETVVNSRYETVENVITPSAVDNKLGGRSIDVNKINAINEDEKLKSKIITAQNAEKGFKKKDKKDSVSVMEATPALEVKQNPTGLVSINEGKIIDADGISTTFFTTKAIGTYVDNLYAQILESTSSIQVDDVKRSQLPAEPESSTKLHKVGLVRLIEGTIVSNNLTTLYESKVIGTVIDGRYAQVIESTSSFLLVPEASAVDNSLNIDPTSLSSISNKVTPTSLVISPTPAVVEGSFSESNGEEGSEEEEEDEIDEDGNKKPKTRLQFQSKKRTFTPVIRPFASRTRTSFNPKRKNSNNEPAIITPSEITPTIKATAVKTDASRNRFAGGRRSSSSVVLQSTKASGNLASSSSRRQFSRPSSTSKVVIQPASSSRARPSSSRIQPSSSFAAGARRTPLFRASTVASNRFAASSINPSISNNRLNNRIRPTLSSAFDRTTGQATLTTPRSDDDDEDEDNTTAITEDPNNVDADESTDVTSTTTENTRRNNNPLLRFRRPQGISRSLSAQPTTQKSPVVTTRRNPLARTTRVTTQAPTTTTSKPRGRTLVRPTLPPPVIRGGAVSARNRTAGSLFPPRGLLRTTPAPQEIEKIEEDENQSGEEDEYEEESKIDEVKTKPVGLSIKKRVKRQSEYGTRHPSYNFRNKRPSISSKTAKPEFYTYGSEEILTEAPKTRSTSRYSPTVRGRSTFNENKNGNSNSRSIKPSPAQNPNRLLFTLREKDNPTTTRVSNFRRPTIASRRTTTQRSNINASSSRYRYQDNKNTNKQSTNTNSRSNNSRGSTNRRSSTRTRSRNDNIDPYVQPSNDGIITITHHIPTEVTIPVVNGKSTEYKNVITEKLSTEILSPKQYSTSIGKNGISTLVLLDDKTDIKNNGITEITQFILNETPTTSIIFTPTTIRGRKTSFSHVIPSTVYDVVPVVSTVQSSPLSNNAPLANILLSQLLLGNIGLNGFNPQQNNNPLLNIQQQNQGIIQQMPATPVTEFKVRTTTYVTTVKHVKSTVLPLTFHGKEILTTIIDESSNVITATEFLTDTIVITPTQQMPQQQQLNSLLLPLLLQQQQAQQAQQNNPLQNINTLPNSFDILNREALESLTDDKQIQSVRDDPNSKESVEDYLEERVEEKVTQKPKKPKKPKNHHNQSFSKKDDPPAKKLDTSIITLYVSGRNPGEFSTVLSTVISESPVYKRSAQYVEVIPSQLANMDILEAEASNNFYEYVLAGSNNEIEPERRSEDLQETESLEIVLGDVNQFTTSLWN